MTSTLVCYTAVDGYFVLILQRTQNDFHIV